eukprot:JP446654.1.p1 GENE.JP446654.1~~JP446654.1.p1  ORF type:complete len:110 (+),score=9.85 JP446654.1:260-589(+)
MLHIIIASATLAQAILTIPNLRSADSLSEQSFHPCRQALMGLIGMMQFVLLWIMTARFFDRTNYTCTSAPLNDFTLAYLIFNYVFLGIAVLVVCCAVPIIFCMKSISSS